MTIETTNNTNLLFKWILKVDGIYTSLQWIIYFVWHEEHFSNNLKAIKYETHSGIQNLDLYMKVHGGRSESAGPLVKDCD